MSFALRFETPLEHGSVISIANQLFRSVVPGILVALLTGGLTLDLLISDRLEREFDAVLATKGQALMALTERENGIIELERYDDVLPNYVNETEPDYFVMRDVRGLTVARSPSVEDETWLAPTVREPGRWHRDIPLPDGRRGRSLSVTFVPEVDDDEVEGGVRSESTPVTLTLAISREPLDKLLRSVHLVLAGTGLALMTTIVLLARRGIRRTLAPLEQIGEQVRALDPARLDQRLALETSSEELTRLTGRFNDMLERLDVAFARERRFSADVAHELRTPLAELRTLGEVNARWPDDETLRRSFTGDHAAAVERMERTVTNLLALARSESGVDGVDVAVDLVELTRRVVDGARAHADERALTLELALPLVPVVSAGECQWRAILHNLVDNACEYALEGTAVRVALRPGTDRDTWCLLVANRTEELTPRDLALMFERLWRKDTARSSTRHGGLGLSLVAAYASQLGIGIDTRLEEGDLVITVTGIVAAPVPASASPSASSVRAGSSRESYEERELGTT